MPNILTIAYTVEGTTDVRLLENIIQRTFEEVAFTCDGEIDVYPVIHIANPKAGGFSQNTVEIARIAFQRGIRILCVHTDADSDNEKATLTNKIKPAFNAVNGASGNICKNLVAVIPIRMSEAWMLADRALFKEEVRTNRSDADLGIGRHPEQITDPKAVIEEAIRIAERDKPKKSRHIAIDGLYQPIGQKVSLNALENLESYSKFKQRVEEAFRRLNLLH